MTETKGRAKGRAIMYYTAFTIISGEVGAVILQTFGWWFISYLGILAWFYVFGLITICVSDKLEGRVREKMMPLYLTMRIVKLLLSIVLLLVYCICRKGDEVGLFIVTFVAFYIWYLVYETWSFSLKEKKRSKENINKKDETIA